MFPRKFRLVGSLTAALTVLVAALVWNSPSDAYVNQIVIDQTATVNFNPIPLGSSVPGASTSYTIYQGRIFGLLDPKNPLNAVITDIYHASWAGFPSAAPNGMVQYVENFQIITPTDPGQRNGLMIQMVPNRGGNAIPTSALLQGVTYVQGGWQGDLLTQCAGANPVPLYPCFNLASWGPYGTLSASGTFTPPTVGTSTLSSYVVQVPVATTDGNPPPGYVATSPTISSPVRCTVTFASGPTAAG